MILDSIKEVRKWYGHHVPRLGSPDLGVFIGDSAYLTKRAAAPTKLKSISLASNLATAMVDMEERNIYFPSAALSRAYYDGMLEEWGLDLTPDEMAVLIVGTIVGLGIHEGSHLRYSFSYPIASEKCKNSQDIKKCDNQGLLQYLHNLVEDWYIDNQSRMKPYGVFTDLILDLYFPPRQFDIAVEEFMDNLDKHSPDTLAQSIMSVLLNLKHPRNREDPVWDNPMAAPLLDNLNRVLVTHNSPDRLDLAWELYQILREYLIDQQKAGGSSEPENMADDALDEISKQMDRHSGNNGRKIMDRPSPYVPSAHKFSGEVTESERLLIAEVQEKFDASFLPNQMDRAIKPIELDILDPRVSKTQIYDHRNKNIMEDPAFSGLGRLLELLRSINVTPGPRKRHGNNILNKSLAGIVTQDPKIFYQKQAIMTHNEIEVILLVDMSGSMLSGNLIGRVLNAAWGAFESLRKSRAYCAVYGHTSGEYDESDQCTVYRIAASGIGESTSDTSRRFKTAGQVTTQNNFDGYAIEAVAKKFTGRDCPKVLLVLSDGQPNGRGYGGPNASKHTANVVRTLRKRGITVISLSLREEVVGSNDNIYGSAFNIAAYSNLEAQMITIIRKINGG